MSLPSRSSLFTSAKLAGFTLVSAVALASTVTGCAAQPTPPAVAAAPPSEAFRQAAGGVTAPQGDPGDTVQFVEQEHKDPQIQGDGPPTDLRPDQSAHPKY